MTSPARPAKTALIIGAALALTALFFAPRLWLMRRDDFCRTPSPSIGRDSIGTIQGRIFATVERTGWPRFLLLSGIFLTGLVSVMLASDLSRSISILVPVVLLGGLRFGERHPGAAGYVLLAAGAMNLLIPTAHLTFDKIHPIHGFPLELIRVLR